MPIFNIKKFNIKRIRKQSTLKILTNREFPLKSCSLDLFPKNI